jgi:hypothetical protein
VHRAAVIRQTVEAKGFDYLSLTQIRHSCFGAGRHLASKWGRGREVTLSKPFPLSPVLCYVLESIAVCFFLTTPHCVHLIVLHEYKVNRCSRRCYVQERPLRDGEWYYSVVIQDDEDFIRRDYSAEAWTEPPEGTIGWWKGRMPEAGARKLVLAPDAVLVDLLRQMGDAEQQGALRYLLALTLLRRRVLRLKPTGEASALSVEGAASDEPDNWMRLQVVADGSEIDVRQWQITRGQTDSLSEALHEVLYCEATD